MSTLTKEWLHQTIADLEEERDAVPGVVNEDAANALAAMKLALASLEAEAVVFRSKLKPPSSIGSEHWDYTDHRQPDAFELENCVIERLYTAPPAPVSVPDAMDGQGGVCCEVSYADGWNSCLAAMLQGAEPVTTAYKLRDAVETIRNSGIAIDAGKIFAERDALNAPDCWCRTCRPITLTDMRFVVCPDCGNKRCPHANDHRNACSGSNEPGQEGSAYPAAPQQEVK
ncbi:hypothetical protein QMS93_24830 [Enterobacter hormaechei]|uniref:hypothetical protein n=1 Tax=Enterobacter hormaechei TaxID=158836 RepID=UPI001A164C81|nr:hypothetical protein [Enterobacter hormaechei]MDK2997729.1 hypothetical protein [Enterobacter hormaechei]